MGAFVFGKTVCSLVYRWYHRQKKRGTSIMKTTRAPAKKAGKAPAAALCAALLLLSGVAVRAVLLRRARTDGKPNGNDGPGRR